MTAYVLLSDSTTQQTLASNDSLFVGDKATLAVSLTAINGMNSTSVVVTVAGTVYGNTGITVGQSSRIMVSGEVLSTNVALTVGNASSISISSGAVVASVNTGIYLVGLTAGLKSNITNEGSIIASDYAVYSIQDSLVFKNTGDVVGEILLSSGNLTVQNEGHLEGAITSGGSSSVLSLTNFGEIIGVINASYSSKPATLLNAGKISGGVTLGTGADSFDNTAGFVGGLIDLGGGADRFDGGAYNDQVFGGSGDDVLKGYAGADVLSGDAGSDTLNGGDGDDVLSGGADGDILTGGAGADRFVAGSDQLGQPADLITDFESGIDKIDVSGVGAGGAVAINFGISNSTVYYQSATAAGGQGVISLYGRLQANDITVGAGTTFFITGSVLGESIVGTSGVDYITGGAGADILTGGAGADIFVYGGIADSPSGANDTITDFETGADKLDFTALGAGSAIAINMGPWSTVYYQTATSGSQGVIGVSGIVRGSDLNVAAGATVYITGTTGADVIYGSKVADYISGGAGDDNIAGGLGADVLTGGAGSDAFYVFAVADSLVAAPDRITDFDPSVDYVDLSSIDANTGAAGQQHFSLVAGFTGAAGQLVSYVSGGFIHFDGDVNGDGVADFAVLVTPTAYWDPYADPSHLRL